MNFLLAIAMDDNNDNNTNTEQQQQQSNNGNNVAESTAMIHSIMANLFIRIVTEIDIQQILNNNSDKSGPLPASKASIEAMPRITVTTETQVQDCSICLDEISVGGEICEMPCKHGFHSSCIEKWLNVHGSCPVCRYVMPVEEEMAVPEEEEDGGDGSENGRQQRRRLIGVFRFRIEPVIVVGSDNGSGNPVSVER